MNNFKRGVFALLGLTLMALTPSAASAEEFELIIEHTEIQETDIKPKVGDTIKFVNKADIAHNLYLTYEDGSVLNLDTQFPGTSKTALLEKSGKVVVRCWIHPIIRLDIDVAEAD